MNRQFNVWSIQEKLEEQRNQKYLEIKLKALRDQYIDELIQRNKCENICLPSPQKKVRFDIKSNEPKNIKKKIIFKRLWSNLLCKIQK